MHGMLESYRSLVALSLVLALLLFKPAPLYILDEVDSALDLSHTQVRGEHIEVLLFAGMHA
jgi:structural maintenance of chromosome 2